MNSEFLKWLYLSRKCNVRDLYNNMFTLTKNLLLSHETLLRNLIIEIVEIDRLKSYL
jgi:hypothetical protein